MIQLTVPLADTTFSGLLADDIAALAEELACAHPGSATHATLDRLTRSVYLEGTRHLAGA